MTFAQASGKPSPAHVPDELFWGHGYEEFAHEGDDPYLAISRLHEGPGMVWSTNVQFGEPGWLVTRHAYVQEVLADWEHFSSDYRALEALGITWKLNPIEFDPPQHHLYRRILNPFFAPARISELDESVKQACESLIAPFEDRGTCEFISEFGEMFPSYVFLELMGMPKERLPDFLEWERGMLRENDPVKRGQAMMAVLKYMEDFVQEQKKNPTTELLKGMVTARYNDERPLNDGELLGMCFLFYIGGLDTVYSVLGWIFRYLAGDQALQERLRANPDDLPRAIEEFLRAFGVAAPTRRARSDYVFQGVQIKAGDLVKPSTPAAGRDPLAYDNPHKIDIDRNARHLSFATGPHICLGMHLARREIRTVLDAFLSRFRNIRIPEGETYQYHTGGVFGIDRLPLAWDRI
jgi:cytochrome P450